MLGHADEAATHGWKPSRYETKGAAPFARQIAIGSPNSAPG